MAALGTLVKKAWSVRRFVVLLSAPLVLVPVLLSLPPKVPAPGHRRGRGGHRWKRGWRPPAAERGSQLGLPPRGEDWGTWSRGHRGGCTAQGHGWGGVCDRGQTAGASGETPTGAMDQEHKLGMLTQVVDQVCGSALQTGGVNSPGDVEWGRSLSPLSHLAAHLLPQPRQYLALTRVALLPARVSPQREGTTKAPSLPWLLTHLRMQMEGPSWGYLSSLG